MLFWIATALFGCRNHCQKLCHEIQEFSEECQTQSEFSHYQFTDQMMDDCLDNQSEKEKEDKQSCKEALPKLQEEWSCEDLSVYFDNPESEEE